MDVFKFVVEYKINSTGKIKTDTYIMTQKQFNNLEKLLNYHYDGISNFKLISKTI